MATPAAILIGSGRGALAAVRALGMRGVDVWVAAPQSVPPGVSRYSRGLVRTPPVDENLSAFIDALTEVAARFSTRPVLLPSDDVTVDAVARNWDRLGACYRLVGPPPAVAGLILDKALQYRTVSEAGIQVPRTWTYDGPADPGPIMLEARFPVLVKPRASQRFYLANGIKALRANTADELERVLARYGDHMLIQELVPGGLENGFEFTSFVDATGRVTSRLVLRKRDVHPRPYGNTTAVETVDEPAIEALGQRVLDALDYRGISQSEFKRDPATGEYFFIEINPRIVNNTAIDTAAGQETVYPAYAQAAGLPFEQGVRRTTRTVWLCPELRLPYSKAIAPPAPLAGSLPGPTRYVTDLFWLSDPAPLFHKAADALRARVWRMIRNRFRVRRASRPPGSGTDVL